ncbi:MAG: 50S ribosomal protein L11 methyltransferase [Myxococcota bacterium]
MNREIQSRVLRIETVSDYSLDVEDIIWGESQPSGLSFEVGKRQMLVYYQPHKFPPRGFIERIKRLPSVASVSSKSLYKKDWNRRWQLLVKPVVIASNIVVVPPFKRYNRSYKGFRKIIINPAMAFGTGHHESTQGIMKLIYKYRHLIKSKHISDFGSGSGILSIFARMLGSDIVDAYDIDSECMAAIKENKVLNNIDGINFFNCSISCCRKRYDVIFANMLFKEISSSSKVIERSLKKGGLLFIAGILISERDELLGLFKRFELIDELVLNDWISFVFKKL